MLKSYSKIAWRNMMKNKTFSFINIFGLCEGLVCYMFISLYILNEMSYDKYQKKMRILSTSWELNKNGSGKSGGEFEK